MKKKNLLFRFAVLVAAMMCALGASAYSFVYNNFYYNITGTNPSTVEVTYKDTNYNSYSGNVTIPSSVTYNGVTYTVTAIGAGAFQNCDYLTGVSIPNTVKTIGVAAFNNCYHYDFTTLVLPPSVITIESSAFDNCTGLTQLTLPASLESIGREAFKNCDNLKHVTIPASVTSIGSDAFGYCSHLLGVTCLAATPPTLSGNYTFYSSVYSGGTLFVPKGSVDAYKSANYWSRFTNVQPHLEYALNEKGSNITFSSTGDYPWTNIVEGSRVYARSGNMGAHNSSSEMTATVTLSVPDSIKFDFKALGEGSNYDVCVFMVDGTQKFSYGSRQDTWETYSAYLSTGTHTLTWRYTKDGSVNPTGDYFAVDNVRLVTEAYACYTQSNTTLTFYYDAQRSSRTGTTYDLNTGNDYPGWYSDNTKINVSKVVFDPSFAAARPTTTCAWFRDMTRLQTITGLNYLNTSQVTSMRGMFAWCDNLQSVDVSNFNTANVTDMIAMFACCEQLSSLNLSHFSTSNVTQMSNMFVGCHQLTSLDVSSFNTDKVTNMYAMFGDCPKLTSLNLSHFNTKKVTDMSLMFHDCSQLQTIYVGVGWSTAAVANSSNMFYGCTSLVGGMGTTYDVNHIDKTYAHIDGGPSNPGYFTAKTEAYACYTPSNTTLTFYYDAQRSSRTGTTYDLNTGNNNPRWCDDGTSSNVTKVVFDPSFAGARPTTTRDWFYGMQNLESITGIEYLNTSEVTHMGWMFMWCTSLTSLDVSHFNTSKVKHMRAMFAYCTGLTSLDLSSFNTANVTDMRAMFYNSTNLRTIYVGNDWSTAAVTYSDDMFWNCTSLVGGKGTTYDENHIDGAYAHIDGGPSNPGYLTGIPEAYACYTESNTTLTFYYDTRRSSRTGTTYDVNLNQGTSLPAWNTNDVVSNVTKAVFDPSFANARPTSTGAWFPNMSKLKSITGLNFLNTSEVTYMSLMFFGCSGLTSLDLSSWNTAMVTNMSHMFQNCSQLQTIYVGDEWSTSAVTQSTYMFCDCTSLVGGQGTHYNVNHIDKAYAHIDGGPSNPGYFTDKNAGLRGDVNGNNEVTIADVSALIDYLLTGDATGINMAAADCNGLDGVTIADVSALIDYLLTGSW